MTIRIDPPRAVHWIARTLEEAGFETWSVGGAVRDAILGRPSQDWDLATRATPGQMRKVFRRTVPIGIDHGTVGVIDQDGVMYEVTTFRKDVETDGRHAVVAFAERIEDDLSRRDFTINAIAWHPLREELLDPFSGAADLKAGIVRTVGRPEERFGEDYLRILRAMRFAGRLDFDIHADTWAALTASVEKLRGLSVERVHEEIWKILEGQSPPSRALGLYLSSGAMSVIAPEVLDREAGTDTGGVGSTGGIGAGVSGGLSGDIPDMAEVLACVDALPAHRPLLRWVTLIRGGGTTAPSDAVSGLKAASDRDARAAVAAVGLMTRLRFSKARIGRTAALIAAGSALPDDMDDTTSGDSPANEAQRRFLSRVGPEHLADLIRLAGAGVTSTADRDRVARTGRTLRGIVQSDAPLGVGDLAFTGRDLIAAGHRPGRWFGDLLEHLLDCALADPTINHRETLAALAESWIAERPS